MKKVKVLLLLIVVCSCSDYKHGNKLLEIDRNSFSDAIKLTGEKIITDKVFAPFSFHVLRDSILFVENKEAYPFYLGIYNLITGEKITEFAKRGRGPFEFLSAGFTSYAYNYNNSNNILIRDIVQHKISEYNFDSVIYMMGPYKPKLVKLPFYVEYFSRYDSSRYVCYNSYFLDSKRFNDVKKIFFYNINEGSPFELNCKYWTANVSGGYISISPDKSRIIVSHLHEDKIEVYDKNLELLKIIIGPDFIKPEYSLEYGDQVSFKPGKRYRGYKTSCHTDNSLYMIYLGLNGTDSKESYYNKPVEVFQFDWNGGLGNRYILDRYLFRLSISSDEKYLYGTSYDSIGEPELVRYSLK